MAIFWNWSETTLSFIWDKKSAYPSREKKNYMWKFQWSVKKTDKNTSIFKKINSSHEYPGKSQNRHRFHSFWNRKKDFFASKKIPHGYVCFFLCKKTESFTEGRQGLALYLRWNRGQKIVHDEIWKILCETGAQKMFKLEEVCLYFFFKQGLALYLRWNRGQKIVHEKISCETGAQKMFKLEEVCLYVIKSKICGTKFAAEFFFLPAAEIGKKT